MKKGRKYIEPVTGKGDKKGTNIPDKDKKKAVDKSKAEERKLYNDTFQQAVSNAKQDFRAGIVSCKKPEFFLSQTNVHYIILDRVGTI